MPNPSIEELRARSADAMPGDPELAAIRIHQVMDAFWELLELITVRLTPEQAIREQQAMLSDCLRAYRTKVQDELLASQKETNDALAKALGGGK